jgi:hypothetical protein
MKPTVHLMNRPDLTKEITRSESARILRRARKTPFNITKTGRDYLIRDKGWSLFLNLYLT